MFRVENGSIYNSDNTLMIDNMAIIFDKETGTFLKCGDVDRSNILNYYATAVDAYEKAGIPNSMTLVRFDRYNGELSIEEICTITNYGMNCHSEKFVELFDMSSEQLHEKVKQLKEFGY